MKRVSGSPKKEVLLFLIVVVISYLIFHNWISIERFVIQLFR